MKSIILTGGTSSRFMPLGSKHLLSFFGRTLLEWHLDQLAPLGIEEYIIICNEDSREAFLQILDNSEKTWSLCVQKDPRGMADGLLQVRDAIGDGAIVISTPGDVLEDHAFTALKKSIEKGQDGALLGFQVQQYFPGGYLELYPNKRIRSIVEKPGVGREPSDLVNIVLHYHKSAADLWRALEATSSTVDDHYEVALAHLFQEKEYYVCPYDGKWQPLKYPWHVLQLLEMMLGFLDEPFIADGVEIAESAVVKGPVFIDEGVRIMDHATVKGPCYIGKNTVVANNALVRDSVIGAHSVVGFGTEVARSYVGSHVWTHSNYVGDSVLMNNVSLGAGAVTANLRLDEQQIPVRVKHDLLDTGRNKIGVFMGPGVRVGVNTSLMPGVKIGADTFIASGLCIGQDLPPRSYVTGKTELTIKENKTSPLAEREALS